MLARTLIKPRLQPASHIEAVAVQGAHSFLKDDVGFSSLREFYSRFEELSQLQVPWQSTSIKDDIELKKDIEYFHRDSLAMLQEILDNPDIASSCVWAPLRQFNGDGQRVYTDMNTADWWWNNQVFPNIDLRSKP